MEHSVGLTETNMKVSSKPIILKAMVDTFGLTAASLKAFGKTIRCMVKARLYGLMVVNTKENM